MGVGSSEGGGNDATFRRGIQWKKGSTLVTPVH